MRPVTPPWTRDSEGARAHALSSARRTDLKLALASAATSSTPLPLGQLTATLYDKLSAHDEFAARDFSVVFEYLNQAREGALNGAGAGKKGEGVK